MDHLAPAPDVGGRIVVLFLLIAALMALVRAPFHNAIRPHDQFRELVFLAVVLLLQLAPVLAGIFAGAPLIAREAENGTLKLAWTQGAARDRWLLAGVVPVTGLPALTAAALGVELRWWLAPAGWAAGNSWLPQLFSLNPLPSAGWVTLGFTLGVCLGALIRRTVPAMAATFAGYAALWLATAASWRARYLTPLHRPITHAQIGPGGSYGYGVSFTAARRPGPNILSTALGWPDGRQLSGPERHHPYSWFLQHHIRVWMTYQPGSRYATFQYIEFGWLVALSLLLIAATVVLVLRRAA